jgi:hypothetical protein
MSLVSGKINRFVERERERERDHVCPSVYGL